MLAHFATLREEADFEACARLMASDITWYTLYNEAISGRDNVLTFMTAEHEAGRRNVDQEKWVRHSKLPRTYQRVMKVLFSTKAKHDVVQTITVEENLIKTIQFKPKYPALAVALAFAGARGAGDEEAALAQMSDKVEWKAWDGFHVEGKEAVRHLFHEQKGREVRTGHTEFEAATVNEQGGVFERLLDIERVDGIKVRTNQRIFVNVELTDEKPLKLADGTVKIIRGLQPKIVEVHVLTTEEMVDGKWAKATEDDHW